MLKKRDPKWRQSIRWGAPRSLLCFSCGLLTCSNKLHIPWVIISALPPADAYIVTEARDWNINRCWSSGADAARDISCGVIHKVRRGTAASMHSPLTCLCWSCTISLLSLSQWLSPHRDIAGETVPTPLLWNNFLDKIKEVKILASFDCLQSFLSATRERETLSFKPRPLWLLCGAPTSRKCRESVCFDCTATTAAAGFWLCSVEGSLWRRRAALEAANTQLALPVAFPNGIMTHSPLCAADLTTSCDRRRDHLRTRFGPHKECMSEGDTPGVASGTAGKGRASSTRRDSGSGDCKNHRQCCLYSRPHVWEKKV